MRLAGVVCSCGSHATIACAAACPSPAFDYANEQRSAQLISERRRAETAVQGGATRKDAPAQRGGERHATPAPRAPRWATRQCPRCKERFTPAHGAHKYCSSSCRAPTPAPKACVDCGATFTPHTSAGLRCPGCITKRASQPPKSTRSYQLKQCVVCRDTFTPTGPRDIRCAGCKGVH